jgi:large subunit ribosomal protein L17
MKSLAVSLVAKGKIKTSEARAKELRTLVERLISYAKLNNLAGQRHLRRFLPMAAANKLVKEIAPRFKERQGGYTRIIKLGRRLSDGARMAIIEFVE